VDQISVSVGFHIAGLFHGANDTCSCGMMVNDTVQSGHLGVNLSEELMPTEVGVSKVELSPFSGLKP
jgi:hypothetical protein